MAVSGQTKTENLLSPSALAGLERIELPASGFGDQRSAV